MEILIVRHGDPDYEHDNLTEKGKREAILLAKKLSKMKIDEYYCSPLGRAKATAAYTLESVRKEAEELDWLHEFRGKVNRKSRNEVPGKDRSCWELMPEFWSDEEIYYTKDWYKTELMQSASTEDSKVELQYKYVIKEFEKFLEKHGYKREGGYFKVLNGNHDRIVFFCHYAIGAVLTSYLLGVSPMVFWNNAVALTTSITTFVTEEREKGNAAFRMMAYGDTGHLYAGDEEPSFAARYCECYEDDTRH